MRLCQRDTFVPYRITTMSFPTTAIMPTVTSERTRPPARNQSNVTALINRSACQIGHARPLSSPRHWDNGLGHQRHRNRTAGVVTATRPGPSRKRPIAKLEPTGTSSPAPISGWRPGTTTAAGFTGACSEHARAKQVLLDEPAELHMPGLHQACSEAQVNAPLAARLQLVNQIQLHHQASAIRNVN